MGDVHDQNRTRLPAGQLPLSNRVKSTMRLAITNESVCSASRSAADPFHKR